MKRRVRVGTDFDDEIRVLKAKRELGKEQTRSVFALGVLAVVAMFLIGAAIVGLIDGSFNELRVVWDIVATPVGGLITFYFTNRVS